jgi:hypothetical protein
VLDVQGAGRKALRCVTTCLFGFLSLSHCCSSMTVWELAEFWKPAGCGTTSNCQLHSSRGDVGDANWLVGRLLQITREHGSATGSENESMIKRAVMPRLGLRANVPRTALVIPRRARC